MAPRHILVTGGSIAANTLAWWLVEGGFRVTVVEEAPAFRDGGQNVDVRGAARTVLQRMGLEEAVKENGTGETGWTIVDEEGEAVARFRLDDLGAEGPTAELEILRGELARLLYERVRDHVEYRFGDAVASVEDEGEAVTVTFKSGKTESYSLVVVAEGVGSSTRELVFPVENEPRWLDMTMGYFTIPKGPGDGSEARWYDTTGGRNIFLRPDNKGTTRAVLSVQHHARRAEEKGVDEQKAWLNETFADAGWEAPRVLAGLDAADDLYVDVLRQVKMDRWSSGRVVLTGDAAWCVTPLGGIGTTLSIVGAYVLAGELSKTSDVGEALAGYERVMRPFVEQGQDVSRLAPRLAHPHTRLGLAVQRTLLSIAAKPGVRDVLAKAATPDADRIDLPEYRFDQEG